MAHQYHCPCPLCASRRNADHLERCWRLPSSARVITIEPLPSPPDEQPTAEPERLPTALILFAAGLVCLALFPIAFVIKH